MSGSGSRSVDVLAVGNAIVDVLATVDDAFLDDHEMTKGSMQLVDASEAERIYAAMPPATEASGGSAANTAVGVASLGGRAAFIGKVRDDQLGAVYTHDLRAAGVRFEVAPGAASGPDPTGRSMVLVTPDAERTMNTNLGIAGQVGPDDVDAELVAASSVVYAEGYLWDSPSAQAALERTFEIARSNGTLVAFSLSDGGCVDRHRSDFAALAAEYVDLLFANEDEIRSLYEVDDFAAAVASVQATGQTAFLTRGALGAVAVRGDEVHTVPAFPVDELVDTTGAGDLFAAGALHSLCAGGDLVANARLGALAAAEVISHLGPRPLVSLRELAIDAGLLAAS